MYSRAPNEAELDALMARLSDGDRTAFDPLFSALHPRAVRVARLRVDGQRAQDVAQTALLKVFSRASEFEAGRPVLPWFYAIVANEVRAVTRGAMVRAQVPLEPDGAPRDIADDREDPEARATERELELAVERAIGTSLLVIACTSAAGFLERLDHVAIDWPWALAVSATSVVGAIVGGRLAGRIAPATLRRAFGVLVMAMAGLVLLEELA